MSREETLDVLFHRIAVARGHEPGDLLLKNGCIVNVFSGIVEEKDIIICGDRIAGVGRYDTAKTTVDLHGAFVLPGLIDGHVHVESSFLIPQCFGRAVLSRGTTAVVADPHEIANVLGKEGLRFMTEDSLHTDLDIFFMVPSAVPSTAMETSGAVLDSGAVAEILKESPEFLGLGEMMNAPGVLFGDDDVLKKLTTAEGKVVDGHFPMAQGRDLAAYCSAGISSDHECVSLAEAREKLSLGMFIQIREGTSARNLEALLPLVDEHNWPNFCFCADDIHAGDLLERGDVLGAVVKAVSLGMPPVRAVQLATVNPARHYGLKHRGAVAPGYLADLVIVDNLKDFSVQAVYKNGKPAVAEGEAAPVALGEVTLPLAPPPFPQIKAGQKARVIRVFPTEIITEEQIYTSEELKAHKDLQKLLVMERHGKNGNAAWALTEGFGLREGCIAQTIAHDSHNLIAVTRDEEEAAFAVKTLEEMGGGIVVTKNHEILAKLDLPVAGLMTWESAKTVAQKEAALTESAHALGVTLPRPFMTLSFLALPVIPKLKLTDMGLFDGSDFSFTNLYF